MMTEQQFHAVARRRRLNPVREARRQHEITRMLNRLDFVPTYKEVFDAQGDFVRRIYTGHIAVRAR